MADYRSIIARAVAHLPSTADEARHAIYEQARTALHERLGNDPRISDTELLNEHYRLEVAIYEVEEDLLQSDMRRFVREDTALSHPGLSFISRIKEFVRSKVTSLSGRACFDVDQCADCGLVVLIMSRSLQQGCSVLAILRPPVSLAAFFYVRSFPPPWTAEVTPNCCIVRDANGGKFPLPQLVAIDDRARIARHIEEGAALDKRVYARVYPAISHPCASSWSIVSGVSAAPKLDAAGPMMMASASKLAEQNV